MDKKKNNNNGGDDSKKNHNDGKKKNKGEEQWGGFGEEFMEAMEEMIRKEVREYVSGSSAIKRSQFKDSNDSGDGGDDGDSGGAGGNNKKNGGGGHGSGGDKSGGSGGSKTKSGKMDFMGQPGFDYRYGYHAGSECGYPVGQLQSIKVQS